MNIVKILVCVQLNAFESIKVALSANTHSLYIISYNNHFKAYLLQVSSINIITRHLSPHLPSIGFLFLCSWNGHTNTRKVLWQLFSFPAGGYICKLFQAQASIRVEPQTIHKLQQAIIIVLQAIHKSPTGKSPSNILKGHWPFT
jgi:hypothetical protein